MCASDRFGHALGKEAQTRAVIHTDLASEQVKTMDTVSTLVDHVEAVVAPILLHGEIACVAIAAMHLDREAIGFEAILTGPTFHDRCEHLEQGVRIARGLPCTGSQLVDEACGIEDEG